MKKFDCLWIEKGKMPTLSWRCICGFFLFLVMFQVSFVEAAEYSFYVDEDADGGGDGSKENPYKKIEKALDEAGSGYTIYIYDGNYDGGFDVPSEVGLYGESKDKVLISGGIRMSNGTSLNNLTITGGGTGITIEPGAGVVLKKCNVTRSSKIGIDMQPGNGKLTVSDSKIYKNGKGLYVQKGNQLQLSGSTVSNNREEGVDIRNKVDGAVKNNTISNNGESGIEIILGSSDMSISNNTISGNAASGIAAQFYADFSKKGKVKINNNKIKNNNQFGVKCGNPSGGTPTGGYWEKSLNLDGNSFGGNDNGDIEAVCKITLDEETDEDVKEIITQTEKKETSAKKQSISAEEKAEAESELSRLKEEEAASIEAELEMSKKYIANIESKAEQDVSVVRKKNKFLYLFSGPRRSTISSLESGISDFELNLEKMRELASQYPYEDMRKNIEKDISAFEQKLSVRKTELDDLKKDQLFWYRLKGIFN